MREFDKKQISENFSRAAPLYDAAAEAQRRMADLLADILPPAPAIAALNAPIVELGCGTGLLTQYLIQKYPGATIHAIDLAPGMIDFCKDRFRDSKNVHLAVADAESYTPPTPAALVVSNCTFQWLADQQRILSKIHDDLSPGGFFALGAMLAGSLPELADSYAAATGRPLPSLPLWNENNYRTELKAAGLKILPSSAVHIFKIQHSSPREAMRALKQIGAIPPRGLNTSPLSPGEMRKLEFHYRSRYNDPVTGRVNSTWHAFIMLAERI